jgi:hypothetical protein
MFAMGERFVFYPLITRIFADYFWIIAIDDDAERRHEHLKRARLWRAVTIKIPNSEFQIPNFLNSVDPRPESGIRRKRAMLFKYV